MSDPRIVYGMCTWWDSIYEASSKDMIPRCPYCNSPLFEAENIEAWYSQADRFPNIDYRAALDWIRGKCSRAMGWEMELKAITSEPPIYELYLRHKDD